MKLRDHVFQRVLVDQYPNVPTIIDVVDIIRGVRKSL